MSVQVSFRWSEDVVEALDHYAQREGRSRSNMAERLLRGALQPVVGVEPMAQARRAEPNAAFKCRVCEFSAGSEKARCPRHPGALVKS